MSRTFNRRQVMRGISTSAVAGAIGMRAHVARAQEPIQVLSHRYPALEAYAAKLRSSLPGVTVNTQLMPWQKVLELSTINLSAKSSAVDIYYVIDSAYRTYAKNGWIRPLDDLWARYKKEFSLSDYADAAVEAYTYKGSIYAIPFALNTLLFDADGKTAPKTIQEYHDLAKHFHNPKRAAALACMKPIDPVLTSCGWYLNALADGWFDKDWKPIFNSAKSVEAIERVKEITQYAQRGYTAAANDECMITLQQDGAVMGPQNSSRALAMDDPVKSRVVGKFEWAPLPQGGGRISLDGYAISSFTKQDPDTLFRIIASAGSSENLKGLAHLASPARTSVLYDAQIAQKNRYYPAALESLKIGRTDPGLPEWHAVGQFISTRLLQAIAGQMPIKEAVDAAAKETEQYLRQHGYY